MITVPRKKHIITLNPNAAFTSGDVLSSSIHLLDCATLNKSMGMKVVGIRVWEKSPEGTQIKASLRFHFYNIAATLPAENAPFTIDNDEYLNHLGIHDVATGDYVEYTDGSDADPDHALLQKNIDPNLSPTFYAGGITNTLWTGVEIRETKTFATAVITVEFDTLMV